MISLKKISLFLCAASILAMTASCNKGKSYAELLTEETHAVNYFLANHRVVNHLPDDMNFVTVSEVGDAAPYYRIDEDGNLYMQVVYTGDMNNKAEEDQLIYFRFTRYNLLTYMRTNELEGEGNSNDLSMGSTSFRFGNQTLSSSATFGSGIQEPLKYLGIDCQVNLVVKSQLGPSSEISSVVPFMYNIRYFSSPL